MGFCFSKSKYVEFCRCEKAGWLSKNKPDVKAPLDDFTMQLFDNGHKVGELAKKRYNVDVDVTAFNKDGKIDVAEMIKKTSEQIALGTRVIAEASFSYNGFYCAVDILVKNDDGGYSIYEVKSSKDEEPTKKEPNKVKEQYKIDVTCQRYILENCGLKINKVYLVLLARDYVRGKTLELDKYFIEKDLTDYTYSARLQVEENVERAKSVILSSFEPTTVVDSCCNKCEYWEYCSKDIAKPSVFDIYYLKFDKKCKLYEQGVSFENVLTSGEELTEFAKKQIEYYGKSDAYIDKANIKSFLNTIKYPIYFLDFETYQAVVPEFEGVETYAQIPFQYSLHYIEKQGGEVKEKHFLDISGDDCRRAISERLIEDIPHMGGGTIIAYNSSTESNIIKRLAGYCPNLASDLLPLTEMFVDLALPFRNAYYYTSAMGKKYSIKYVAPAIFPNDKSMNYSNLDGVKNGGDAMSVIFRVNDMTEEEKARIERELLIYCGQDTISMVKIWQKLCKVVEQ